MLQIYPNILVFVNISDCKDFPESGRRDGPISNSFATNKMLKLKVNPSAWVSKQAERMSTMDMSQNEKLIEICTKWLDLNQHYLFPSCRMTPNKSFFFYHSGKNFIRHFFPWSTHHIIESTVKQLSHFCLNLIFKHIQVNVSTLIYISSKVCL